MWDTAYWALDYWSGDYWGSAVAVAVRASFISVRYRHTGLGVTVAVVRTQ